MDQINDGRVIRAERLEKSVGFAVVLRRDDGNAELDGLFVEPALWRQGIGHALIGESLKLARADGVADAEKSWLTGETPVR